MNVLKGWEEDEAIDTLMAWPGELRPFLGLASYLQGFWGAQAENNKTPPRELGGRVMCWIYGYPDRWETVKRSVEMAAVHDAALREGKVTTHALRTEWREFAREVSRHADILKRREEHKQEAQATQALCKKV